MNDRVVRYYKRFNAIITFVTNRLADFTGTSKVPGYLVAFAGGHVWNKGKGVSSKE